MRSGACINFVGVSETESHYVALDSLELTILGLSLLDSKTIGGQYLAWSHLAFGTKTSQDDVPIQPILQSYQ